MKINWNWIKELISQQDVSVSFRRNRVGEVGVINIKTITLKGDKSEEIISFLKTQGLEFTHISNLKTENKVALIFRTKDKIEISDANVNALVQENLNLSWDIQEVEFCNLVSIFKGETLVQKIGAVIWIDEKYVDLEVEKVVSLCLQKGLFYLPEKKLRKESEEVFDKYYIGIPFLFEEISSRERRKLKKRIV